jgi:hypothetical protein
MIILVLHKPASMKTGKGLIFHRFVLPLFPNKTKNEYKCQTRKMADSPKEAQVVGQTRSDGAGMRPESRQTGEDRQS